MPKHVYLHGLTGKTVKESDSNPQAKFQLQLELSQIEMERLQNGKPLSVKLDLKHEGTDADDFGKITVGLDGGTKSFKATDALEFDLTEGDVTTVEIGGVDHYYVNVPVTVAVNDDSRKEKDEKFTLSVAEIGGQSGFDAKQQRTIIDDDGKDESVAFSFAADPLDDVFVFDDAAPSGSFYALAPAGEPLSAHPLPAAPDDLGGSLFADPFGYDGGHDAFDVSGLLG